MITKLFNHARTLWQKPDGEYEFPEQAISGSTDAIGLIVLEQEGATIRINRASVHELCAMLRDLKKCAEATT